ncbi:MAG TPA: type II CAAX endopeptidase family protein [Bdellovibrionota bacterium]|nr:type II CAAX endopeptidase family protein [Bdellovibrionota bacterium]
MIPAIGLGWPVGCLIAFAVIYQPYVMKHLPNEGWAAIALSPQMFFLITSIWMAKIRNLRKRHFGFDRPRILKDALLGLGIGLIPAFLTVAGAMVLTGLDHFFSFLPRPMFGGLPVPIRFHASTLFVLLVLAPISEEIFFRGILVRALRESYSPLTTVLFSSVIFMGGHGGFKIGPLLLGLITAPITLMTGSIVPGIVFHAISNGYGPLLVTWFPNLYRYLDFFFQ